MQSALKYICDYHFILITTSIKIYCFTIHVNEITHEHIQFFLQQQLQIELEIVLFYLQYPKYIGQIKIISWCTIFARL